MAESKQNQNDALATPASASSPDDLIQDLDVVAPVADQNAVSGGAVRKQDYMIYKFYDLLISSY